MSLEIINNITIIFILNLIFFISIYPIGKFTNRCLKIELKSNELILWVGLITLSLVLMIIHFFFSINNKVIITIILISSAYFFKNKEYLFFFNKQKNNLITIFFYLVCLFILTKQEPLYDTGLYHLQAIQWVKEFNLIPGIANLNDRLGFNIIYYYLSSFVNLPFTNNLSHISVSLFVYVLAFATIINLKIFKNLNIYWIISFALIGLAFKRYLVASASPDLLVFVFSLIAALYFLKIIIEENTKSENFYFLIFILFFSFFFKLTSIFFSFFMTLSLLIYAIKNKVKFFNLRLVLFCSFFLFCWILRSYLLSGMPFFPNTFLSWTILPWHFSNSLANDLSIDFYNWSVNTSIISDTKTSLYNNLFFWLKNTPLFSKIYFVLIIFFLFFLILKINKFNKQLLWILIPNLLNIIFLFSLAPQVRFLESSIVIILLILCYNFHNSYSESVILNNSIITKSLSTTVLIMFIFITFFKSIDTFASTWKGNKNYLLKNITTKKNDFITINVPMSGDQCWGSQIPCSFNLHPNLKKKYFTFLGLNYFYFTIKK